MEIIIVDDGSTDDYTPYVVKRLEERYPNVKTYLYPQGAAEVLQGREIKGSNCQRLNG